MCQASGRSWDASDINGPRKWTDSNRREPEKRKKARHFDCDVVLIRILNPRLPHSETKGRMQDAQLDPELGLGRIPSECMNSMGSMDSMDFHCIHISYPRFSCSQFRIMES